MSLADQERLLLALVVDDDVRARFLASRALVCAEFQLTADEAADFDGVTAHGLAVDARERRAQLITRVQREFPLTLGMLRAIGDADDVVADAFGAAHFDLRARERPAALGKALLDAVRAEPSLRMQPPLLRMAEAVAQLELSLALSAGMLRATVAAGRVVDVGALALQAHHVVRLAPFVSQALLPYPLAAIQEAVHSERTLEALAAQPGAPRLHLAHARVSGVASFVDVDVVHSTFEVHPGFASVLAAFDGKRSVQSVLHALQEQGGAATLVEQIRGGLERLALAGVLVQRP